jgi:hypothetical protein
MSPNDIILETIDDLESLTTKEPKKSIVNVVKMFGL